MAVNRRHFLAGGAGLLAATAASSRWLPDALTGEATATFQPEVRRSAFGRLDTKLVCRFARHQTTGRSLYTRTFDNAVPGPTLRVRAGDTIRLRLNNRLPPNDGGHDHDVNVPHDFNTTNIHTHGLHVSPADRSDNVLRELEPGERFDVVIEIPEDHTPGTYWYHPHKHGSSFMQLGGGMAGALIVEGEIDEVPEIAAAEDLVMVINGLHVDADGNQYPEFATSNSDNAVYTLNGRVTPTLRMNPGEVQRWRFVQALADKYAPIQLDGHAFHVIARDGLTLPETQTVAGRIDLAPGQRVDVLVKAGAPGVYMLRMLANAIGGGNGLVQDHDLAKVIVKGVRRDMGLPTALPVPPGLTPITDDELVAAPPRQLVFKAGGGLFQIDCKSFDAGRLDQVMVKGTAEEWTVSNANPGEHPFHIHTNPFWVIKRNGVDIDPVWLDTVSIPGTQPDGSMGSVTFRTRFLDFTGRFVVHCHLLEHEDQGMMQLVEIVEPGETREVSPTACTAADLVPTHCD